MQVHLIITFTAKPDSRDAFAALLASVPGEVLKVHGCKGALVLQSASDLCLFTLLETWESEERHRVHLEHVVSSGPWDHIATPRNTAGERLLPRDLKLSRPSALHSRTCDTSPNIHPLRPAARNSARSGTNAQDAAW